MFCHHDTADGKILLCTLLFLLRKEIRSWAKEVLARHETTPVEERLKCPYYFLMRDIYVPTLSGLEVTVTDGWYETVVNEFHEKLVEENYPHGDNILDDAVLGINDAAEDSVKRNIVPCNIYFLAAFCSLYRCACNLLSCTYNTGNFLKVWITFRPDPEFGGVIMESKRVEEGLLENPSPEGPPVFINFTWLTKTANEKAKLAANQHIIYVESPGKTWPLHKTYAKRYEMRHGSELAKTRRAFFLSGCLAPFDSGKNATGNILVKVAKGKLMLN